MDETTNGSEAAETIDLGSGAEAQRYKDGRLLVKGPKGQAFWLNPREAREFLASR